MDEYTTVQEALDAYDDMLDEVYPDLTIAGMEYQTSRVLKEIDPIAYRVGFSDWTDSEDIDSDALTGWDEVDL